MSVQQYRIYEILYLVPQDADAQLFNRYYLNDK